MLRAICIFGLVWIGVCLVGRVNGDPPAAADAAPARCSLHHVTLLTVRGYGLRQDGVCVLVSEDAGLRRKFYPCALTPYQSLDRRDFFTEPVPVTYCPECQMEMEKRARRSRRRQDGKVRPGEH